MADVFALQEGPKHIGGRHSQINGADIPLADLARLLQLKSRNRFSKPPSSPKREFLADYKAPTRAYVRISEREARGTEFGAGFYETALRPEKVRSLLAAAGFAVLPVDTWRDYSDILTGL